MLPGFVRSYYAASRCPKRASTALVPDDLLVMKEPDAEQGIEDLACELGRVPNAYGLAAGYQFEGFGPIGPGIAGDRGFLLVIDEGLTRLL